MQNSQWPKAFSTIVVFLGAAASLYGQATPYPNEAVRPLYDKFLRSIQRIPIFDNHSHPGYADDPDVDAMALPPGSLPYASAQTIRSW